MTFCLCDRTCICSSESRVTSMTVCDTGRPYIERDSLRSEGKEVGKSVVGPAGGMEE